MVGSEAALDSGLEFALLPVVGPGVSKVSARKYATASGYALREIYFEVTFLRKVQCTGIIVKKGFCWNVNPGEMLCNC